MGVKVHCRVCHQDIDKELDTDWVMPSKNFYYHKTCYEQSLKRRSDVHTKEDDEFWRAAVWDYLHKTVRIQVDFIKLSQQWKTFLKRKMTAKGIYFALRYFYEVKKEDPDKSGGGIGIVPYIYSESCEYWIEKEERDTGICARIEQQIREQNRAEQKTVNIKRAKKKKDKFSLEEISSMED